MGKEYLKKYAPSSLIHLWRYFYNKNRDFACYIYRKNKLHTYAGYPLSVYISDPVGAGWYDHDSNRDEITFLKKH